MSQQNVHEGCETKDEYDATVAFCFCLNRFMFEKSEVPATSL